MIKMQVKQGVLINSPIEETFAYVSNLEGLANWSSVITSSRQTSSGTIQVGATLLCTVHFLGRWSHITFEVIEYEPNSYLTIKSIAGTAPCLFCYQFEALTGGGTAVTQEAIIHLTEGSSQLAEATLTSVVRRQLHHDLLTLKDLLEASTSLCKIVD